MPTRWRLIVEYDGTSFAGWQFQPGQRSIQGELEAAVARVFQEQVRITASGRTDAGVHALGQVISFAVETERTPREARDGLNALLPEDIAVIEAEVVPLAFDPRRWAKSKRYRYAWICRPGRSPLRRQRAWHVPYDLDAEAMHRAAQVLVGRHDLSSFRAVGCSATHPVRVVEELTVRRADDELHLWVHGTGFLRHTVRIIAGTLIQVGRGRRPESWVGDVLTARDRAAAGRTAPAHGLTLVDVAYGTEPPPWMRGEEDSDD